MNLKRAALITFSAAALAAGSSGNALAADVVVSGDAAAKAADEAEIPDMVAAMQESGSAVVEVGSVSETKVAGEYVKLSTNAESAMAKLWNGRARAEYSQMGRVHQGTIKAADTTSWYIDNEDLPEWIEYVSTQEEVPVYGSIKRVKGTLGDKVSFAHATCEGVGEAAFYFFTAYNPVDEDREADVAIRSKVTGEVIGTMTIVQKRESYRKEEAEKYQALLSV